MKSLKNHFRWVTNSLLGLTLLAGYLVTGCVPGTPTAEKPPPPEPMTLTIAPSATTPSELATPTERKSEPMQIIWKIEATAPEAISITGQGTLEELRRALYDKSNVAKALFGSAPIALNLKGGVAKGDDLLLTIESNPSTGASWQVVDIDTAILSQAGETYFMVDATGLEGGFQHQVIPLKVVADGSGVITLMYCRFSCGPDVQAVRQVSIEAKQMKDILDLTDPIP